jgi:hypothetical protein
VLSEYQLVLSPLLYHPSLKVRIGERVGEYMEKDQLLELRSKIVQKTQQLAIDGQGSPSDRLQVLLSIIQAGGANAEILNKTFELTESIEGDDEKLSALLEVLYEVDARLGVVSDEDPSAMQEHSVQETEENHQ